MNLKIIGIRDVGDIAKERVVMRARVDLDMGDYALLRTGYVNGEVNIGVTNTYWFPGQRVKAGELVILYSKDGVDRHRDLASSGRSYFFYWGAEETQWNSAYVSAVLLEAPNWQSFQPSKS